MAATIFSHFKPVVKQPSAITEIKLIPGSGGAFEITLDGELVFSKKDAKRFPENDEILGIIQRGLNPK